MMLLRPWVLIFALLPLLLVQAKHIGRIGPWKKICDEHLLPYLAVKVQGSKSTFYKWYAMVLWMWLVVAASGPAILQTQQETFSEKKAIVAVLDMSPAMTETLLSEARFKLFDFLKTTEADVGFVISDAKAYTVVPITSDKTIVQQVLPTVNSTVAPLVGSAPEKGLQRAEELLKQAGYTQGQILLLTAGIVHEKALELGTEKLSYPVAILGFGESSPHPMAWKKDFWKDAQGVPYQASLDPQVLGRIGFYQKSVLDNRDLERIAQQEGVMEKTKHPWEDYQDVGVWMVLAVLPFVAVLFRRGLLWVVILALWATPSYATLFTRQEQEAYALQEQAVQAYRRKDFTQAEELFAAADDLYNQANARAMQHNFEGAIDLYEQELVRHPDNEDARFNRDYLKELLQQQAQQQQDNTQEKKEGQNDNRDQQQGGTSESQQSEQQEEQGEQPEQQAEPQQSEQQGEQQQQPSSQQSGQQQSEENAEQAEHIPDSTSDSSSQNSPQEMSPENSEQPVSPEDFEKQQQQQWLGKIEPDVSGLLRYRLHKQAEEGL